MPCLIHDVISAKKTHILGLFIMHPNVASDDLYQKIVQKITISINTVVHTYTIVICTLYVCMYMCDLTLCILQCLQCNVNVCVCLLIAVPTCTCTTRLLRPIRYSHGDFMRGTVLVFLPGLPEIKTMQDILVNNAHYRKLG